MLLSILNKVLIWLKSFVILFCFFSRIFLSVVTVSTRHYMYSCTTSRWHGWNPGPPDCQISCGHGGQSHHQTEVPPRLGTTQISTKLGCFSQRTWQDIKFFHFLSVRLTWAAFLDVDVWFSLCMETTFPKFSFHVIISFIQSCHQSMDIGHGHSVLVFSLAPKW